MLLRFAQPYLFRLSETANRDLRYTILMYLNPQFDQSCLGVLAGPRAPRYIVSLGSAPEGLRVAVGDEVGGCCSNAAYVCTTLINTVPLYIEDVPTRSMSFYTPTDPITLTPMSAFTPWVATRGLCRDINAKQYGYCDCGNGFVNDPDACGQMMYEYPTAGDWRAAQWQPATGNC
eukprot:gene22013-8614_t